jgi:hypothetical protein
MHIQDCKLVEGCLHGTPVEALTMNISGTCTIQ